MFNVDEIKSILNVSGGPSLRCNYMITVCPPVSILGATGGLSANVGGKIVGEAVSFIGARQTSMLAINASIPGRIISTTPHRMYGTIREMPYGALYEPIQITFLCTNSMFERTFFNLWQENIMDHKSYYMKYYQDYVGSIIIQKLSGGDLFGSPDAGSLVGDTVSIYILEDAYPKVIAEQELSYGSKNEYMTLTVEFSYAKWSHSLSSISNLIGSAAINALDAAERALF